MMSLRKLDYSIGTLRINPGLVLAPMSGVTSSAFRRLIKELNPGAVGLLVSEFISVEGLTRESRRSLEMLRFDKSERPVGIQIFGYDVNRMRDAAKLVEDCGADLVDINCGCPAPKVVKRGGGCELMRQPLHLIKILQEVRKAVKIPLTIKFRAGWDEASRNAMEIAHIAESEGADAIAIHGRTRAQLYRGEADWNLVREVVEEVKIPVCGSGDVVDLASAQQRLTQGGVAGLFIGRGSLSNPYIFSEIAGIPVQNRLTPIQILRRYADLLIEERSEKSSIGKLKQLGSQMVRAPWMKDFCRAMELKQQLEILERAAEVMQ